MKLHQLFTLYTVLFQSFACFGMDLNMVLFDMKKERLPFPEPHRQQLVNYCRIQLAQHDLQKIAAETRELKKEVKDLQEIDRVKKLENANLLNKIHQMEQETKVLQKALVCIEEKKSIATIPNKELSIKKDTTSQKKLIKRSPQNSDKLLTTREKLEGFKILKTQYRVRERWELLAKLREEADSAYSKNSPSFDKKCHFLCKEINAKYRFIYCPCTQQLAIVNYSNQVAVPKNLSCGDNCSFYKPTKTSSSNTSLESDTVLETQSESNTEEDLNPILLTKETIEKVCN